MTIEDPAHHPVHRFVSFRGGPLDGEVVEADPGLSSAPGEKIAPEWVELAVSAARLDDEAREYRWTGQVLAPAPGRQIIVLTPDGHNDLPN